MEFKNTRSMSSSVSGAPSSAHSLHTHAPAQSTDSEHALFSGEVPVTVSTGSREELKRSLHFHMYMATEAPQNLRVLRVRVTEEADPFFLYTLNVSEATFATLKRDQSLLVDFSSFPNHFVQLLQFCQDGDKEPIAKYIALFKSRNNHTELSLMETSQFKHLHHLSLEFRPGNDSTVKGYLADRVAKFKTLSENLQTSLDDTQRELDTRTRDLETLRGRYSELEIKNAKTVDQLRNEFQAEKNALNEEKLATRQKMQHGFDTEKNAMQADSQAKIAELESLRKEHLEKIETLTENRLSNENSLRELRSSLESHKSELCSTKTELVKLKDECRTFEQSKFEQEKEIHKHLLRISNLEQQIRDKDELAKKMSALTESTTEQKASLQASVEMYKRDSSVVEKKYRECCAEIEKGNRIITKFQRELRSKRHDLKARDAQLKERDDTIDKYQKKIDELEHELVNSTKEIQEAKRKSTDLEKTVDDREKKIEESEKLLESNKQVISWLNQQVTETELSRAQFPPGTGAVSGGLATGGSQFSRFTSSSFGTTGATPYTGAKYGNYTSRYPSVAATNTNVTPFKPTLPPYRSSLANNENRPSAANVSTNPATSSALKTGVFTPSSYGTQRSLHTVSFPDTNVSVVPAYNGLVNGSSGALKPRKLSEGLDMNPMPTGPSSPPTAPSGNTSNTGSTLPSYMSSYKSGLSTGFSSTSSSNSVKPWETRYSGEHTSGLQSGTACNSVGNSVASYPGTKSVSFHEPNSLTTLGKFSPLSRPTRTSTCTSASGGTYSSLTTSAGSQMQSMGNRDTTELKYSYKSMKATGSSADSNSGTRSSYFKQGAVSPNATGPAGVANSGASHSSCFQQKGGQPSRCLNQGRASNTSPKAFTSAMNPTPYSKPVSTTTVTSVGMRARDALKTQSSEIAGSASQTFNASAGMSDSTSAKRAAPSPMKAVGSNAKQPATKKQSLTRWK